MGAGALPYILDGLLNQYRAVHWGRSFRPRLLAISLASCSAQPTIIPGGGPSTQSEEKSLYSDTCRGKMHRPWVEDRDGGDHPVERVWSNTPWALRFFWFSFFK